MEGWKSREDFRSILSAFTLPFTKTRVIHVIRDPAKSVAFPAKILYNIVKSTITWTSRMGEDTILASGGVGLVPPEMSTYFRALL